MKTILIPNNQNRHKPSREERKASQYNNKTDSKYVTQNSQQEQMTIDRINRLYNNTAMEMTDFLRTGQEFIAQKDSQRADNANRLNQMWQRRMLLMVVGSFQDGINTSNIMRAAGIYTGLALASPEIRRMTHNAIGDYFTNKADKKELKEGGETLTSQLYRNIGDKHKAKGNFNHIPFTSDSAAIMHISMTKEVYAKMRDPNTNCQDLMDQYEQAEALLEGMCKRDGVAWDDVCKQEHIIIGRLCMADPKQAEAFNDIMYQGVHPAKAHKTQDIYYDSDGKPQLRTQAVWTGEFENEQGKPYNEMFKPRLPLDIDTLSGQLASQYDKAYSQITSQGVPERQAMFILTQAMFKQAGMPWNQHVENIPLNEQQQKTMDSFNYGVQRWYTMGEHDGMTYEQQEDATGVAFAEFNQTQTVQELYKNAKNEDDLWTLKQGDGVAKALAQYSFPDSKSRDDAIREYTKQFASQCLRYELSQGNKDAAQKVIKQASLMQTTIMREADNYQVAFQYADADNPTRSLDAVSQAQQSVCEQWVTSIAGKGKSPLRDSAEQATKYCDTARNKQLEQELHDIFSKFGGTKIQNMEGNYNNSHTTYEQDLKDRQTQEEQRKQKWQQDRGRQAEQQFEDIFKNFNNYDGEYTY